MIYEFDGMRPTISPTAYVSESATIIGDVTVGAYCYIGPGAVIRGDARGCPITIGAGTAVEEGVIIHVGGKDARCDIGEKVTIGHGALVHCNKLGKNANVGMGAVLSLYAEIGEYAIVAEGAVVKQRQKIPPRVVVGGAPAVTLRELSEQDISIWDKTKEWYIDLVKKYSAPGVLKRIDGLKNELQSAGY